MFENNIVLNTLTRAGWYPNRKLDKSYIINLLSQADLPVLSCAIEFLESFGDIKVLFKNERNGLPDDDIDLKIEHAINLESSEYILGNYVPRIKKNLCIIGTAYRDHFILLMAEDGQVYGGYDSFLCKISDRGTKVFEAIILDYEFEEID